MTEAAVQHAHAVRAALEALTAELAAGQQLAGRLAPAVLGSTLKARRRTSNGSPPRAILSVPST